MQFIKQHWFGIISGFFIFVFVCLFVLVLLSPRQDEQKRGFIPCTEELAQGLLVCEEGAKIPCLFGVISRNTWCDMKVIAKGFADWTMGRQPAPWSNYIFEPELPQNDTFDAEQKAEYLKTNPAPALEMQELIKLNKELENEIIREEVDENEKPQ